MSLLAQVFPVGQLTDYYDYPVCPLIPEPPDGGSRTQTFAGETFQPVTAGLERHTLTPYVGGAHEFTYLGTTRAEVQEAEAWFDARRGSRDLFWFPTWQRELGVQQVLSTVAGFKFVVSGMHYTEILFPQEIWRWLAAIVQPTGGQPYLMPARVYDAHVNSGLTEDIFTYGDYHSALATVATVIGCRLCLGRIADDTVETRWHTLQAGSVVVRLEEVPIALTGL